ncbi:unnamed protein product, partial [Chrysoparadoxa australica]
MRVLGVQSESPQADTQLKVLQTVVMTVTWPGCQMTEETVSQALGTCLSLAGPLGKHATVRNAARMTARQIISQLFDRAAAEMDAGGEG